MPHVRIVGQFPVTRRVPSLDYSRFCWRKKKRCSKRLMNTGFSRTRHSLSEHPEMTSCISQLLFSFSRHRPIRADFSGGQISSDAGLLPLRAFDERYGLTRGLAERVGDPRDEDRIGHSVLSLFRQRLYQIIAGYEDANDADRLRHDPAFQILADQPLGEPLGSQPTLSRWENSP